VPAFDGGSFMFLQMQVVTVEAEEDFVTYRTAQNLGTTQRVD